MQMEQAYAENNFEEAAKFKARTIDLVSQIENITTHMTKTLHSQSMTLAK